MQPPKVWGHGALFVFSGLEGKTCFNTQLIGTLMGDHPGIRFTDPERMELFCDTYDVKDIVWDCVASDVIIGRLLIAGEWKEIKLVFAKNATVKGKLPKDRLVFTRLLNPVEGKAQLMTTESGEYVYFSLSLENDGDCSADSIENLCAQRLNFFAAIKNPLEGAAKNADIAEAFAKMVSVMKSQVYAPEGIFSGFWTTPDRYPHKRMWLWDSCFHSMGNRAIDEKLARDSIYSVFEMQTDEGFIPHMADCSGKRSDITQPPVIAWTVEKLVKRTNDIGFAEKCYDRLKAYLKWDMDNRRTASGLFYWHINRKSVVCRCDESGMDNCSRFDNVEEMECVDAVCFMIREAQAMEYLAELLGRREDADNWKEFEAETARIMNERLWDEKDGYYYDRELKTDSLHKVKSVASFLPLFAGVCPETRIPRLISALNDPGQFNTPVCRAGISRDDPTFGKDMWCGPVWINYMYFIAEGLYRAGYKTPGDEMIADTVREIAHWYKLNGVTYEFYDCMGILTPPLLERKGPSVNPYTPGARMQSIRDYGWTATLFAAMVMEHTELFSE